MFGGTPGGTPGVLVGHVWWEPQCAGGTFLVGTLVFWWDISGGSLDVLVGHLWWEI